MNHQQQQQHLLHLQQYSTHTQLLRRPAPPVVVQRRNLEISSSLNSCSFQQELLPSSVSSKTNNGGQSHIIPGRKYSVDLLNVPSIGSKISLSDQNKSQRIFNQPSSHQLYSVPDHRTIDSDSSSWINSQADTQSMMGYSPQQKNSNQLLFLQSGQHFRYSALPSPNDKKNHQATQLPNQQCLAGQFSSAKQTSWEGNSPAQANQFTVFSQLEPTQHKNLANVDKQIQIRSALQEIPRTVLTQAEYKSSKQASEAGEQQQQQQQQQTYNGYESTKQRAVPKIRGSNNSFNSTIETQSPLITPIRSVQVENSIPCPYAPQPEQIQIKNKGIYPSSQSLHESPTYQQMQVLHSQPTFSFPKPSNQTINQQIQQQPSQGQQQQYQSQPPQASIKIQEFRLNQQIYPQQVQQQQQRQQISSCQYQKQHLNQISSISDNNLESRQVGSVQSAQTNKQYAETIKQQNQQADKCLQQRGETPQSKQVLQQDSIITLSIEKQQQNKYNSQKNQQNISLGRCQQGLQPEQTHLQPSLAHQNLDNNYNNTIINSQQSSMILQPRQQNQQQIIDINKKICIQLKGQHQETKVEQYNYRKKDINAVNRNNVQINVLANRYKPPVQTNQDKINAKVSQNYINDENNIVQSSHQIKTMRQDNIKHKAIVVQLPRNDKENIREQIHDNQRNMLPRKVENTLRAEERKLKEIPQHQDKKEDRSFSLDATKISKAVDTTFDCSDLLQLSLSELEEPSECQVILEEPLQKIDQAFTKKENEDGSNKSTQDHQAVEIRKLTIPDTFTFNSFISQSQPSHNSWECEKQQESSFKAESQGSESTNDQPYEIIKQAGCCKDSSQEVSLSSSNNNKIPDRNENFTENDEAIDEEYANILYQQLTIERSLFQIKTGLTRLMSQVLSILPLSQQDEIKMIFGLNKGDNYISKEVILDVLLGSQSLNILNESEELTPETKKVIRNILRETKRAEIHLTELREKYKFCQEEIFKIIAGDKSYISCSDLGLFFKKNGFDVREQETMLLIYRFNRQSTIRLSQINFYV